MRIASLTLLLLMLAGCASVGDTRPAGMSRPDVQIRQTNQIFFGGGSEAPAFFEVDVSNTGEGELIVRRIQIDSPGMAQWALRPIARTYNDKIAPGGTKTIAITANAVTQTARPVEPLSVRVTVEFTAGGVGFREIYTAQAELGPY